MEFDLQPTLKGNLIEVRPLAREDFDALLQAASDPLSGQRPSYGSNIRKETATKSRFLRSSSRGQWTLVAHLR